MNDRPGRARIIAHKNRLLPIEDAEAYKKNACSEMARKVSTVTRHTNFDIWFDKHYHNRQQHGDENGKREGIDNDAVEDLLKRGLRLLLFYSNITNGFSFLNGLGVSPARRIVLKEIRDERILNVVVEVHTLDLINYEVTVKTAMCVDSFRVQDGQFVIEIDGETSCLKKCEVGKMKEIFSI